MYPDPTPAEQAEALEARIRRGMHEHSSIKDRGFDTARLRNEIHRSLDVMFDDHAALLEIVALEQQVAS